MTGLVPSDIATRADLDLAELENIVAARTWVSAQTWTVDRLLAEATLKALHRRMFGDVWRWAGTFRKRQTNVGSSPHAIAVDLRSLLDDTRAWIEFATFEADVIALRFHHRLVLVHVFPNGNGRHARLCADLLVGALGRPAFSWGGRELVDASAARDAYLAALRDMDRNADDVAALLAFARAA